MKIGIATLERNLEISGDIDNCGPCPSPLANKRGKGSPLKELVFLLVTGKQPSKDR